MEINLIAETFKFLILGMSTVFLFLTLMVIVLEIQSKIIVRFFPSTPEEINVTNNQTPTHSHKDNLSVAAAIAASIHSYKQSK